MSHVTFVLLCLLLLVFTCLPSSAQLSSSPSSPLQKLRGKLTASIRPPYTVRDASAVKPLVSLVEADADVDAPIGIASILPYRTPAEVAAQPAESTHSSAEAVEQSVVDDERTVEEDVGQEASILPYGTEQDVRTTESAVLTEEAEWQGEVASILPYRETDADELREAAQEDEGSEFAVASIVPFDSDRAIDSKSDEIDLSTGDDEEAAANSVIQKESEWAKRSRVRRYRLRRWLLQKKLGEPIIYSQ